MATLSNQGLNYSYGALGGQSGRGSLSNNGLETTYTLPQVGHGKVEDFFKKAGNVINHGLKDSKIISTFSRGLAAPAGAVVGTLTGNPLAGAAVSSTLNAGGNFASSKGYGRGKKRRTPK